MPDPLGPMMPRILPGSARKLMPTRIGRPSRPRSADFLDLAARLRAPEAPCRSAPRPRCSSARDSRRSGRPRGAERRPAADDALDRLQRAAQEHRRGDDRARRDVAGDRQQGAERQAPTDWTNRRKNRLVAVSLPPANCALTMLASAMPAVTELPLDHRAGHAEALDGRAVDRRRLLRIVRGRHRRRRDLHLLLRRALVEPGEGHEEDRRRRPRASRSRSGA